MITEAILDGGSFFLRQIELSDCTCNYVNWLNNPIINQCLETRWKKQSLNSIREFVNDQRNNDHSILFAIVIKKDRQHIGNIKLGPINRFHNHADISYFIGEESYWNRGIATKAINLVAEYAFYNLDIHKVEAGCYSSAIGSQKALEKNFFIKEAVFREKVIYQGRYHDVYRYGLLKKEFRKSEDVL